MRAALLALLLGCGHPQPPPPATAQLSPPPPPPAVAQPSPPAAAQPSAVAQPTPPAATATATVTVTATATSGAPVSVSDGFRPHHSSIPERNLTRDHAVGGVDADAVASAIRKLRSRFVRCSNLVTDPKSVQGPLSTSFTIGSAGTVTAVKITGIDPKVAACLENVIRSLKITPPPQGGPVVVSYPFNVDPFPE